MDHSLAIRKDGTYQEAKQVAEEIGGEYIIV